MNFEVGYGTGIQQFALAKEQWMGTLMANPVEKGLTGVAAVEDALDHPIGLCMISHVTSIW